MVSPSQIAPPPPPPYRKRYCCAYCGTKWTQEQCRNCGASERKEIKYKFTRPVLSPNKILEEPNFFNLGLPSFLLKVLSIYGLCAIAGITLLLLLIKYK